MLHEAISPAAAGTAGVRVHTLGRFAVEVDGAPLRFGVKGPRKPLALLKALIARGGRGVRAEPLVEALWPDADGDHAQRSFRVALHRLLALLAASLLVLAASAAAAPDGKAIYDSMGCNICHGEDGRTPQQNTYPIIAGQMPRYTYLALQGYKSGKRQGGGSNLHVEVSDLLSDADMKAVADYIAKMK